MRGREEGKEGKEKIGGVRGREGRGREGWRKGLRTSSALVVAFVPAW